MHRGWVYQNLWTCLDLGKDNISLRLRVLKTSLSCPRGRQSCILLNDVSVISSKFINKFAQKCQYFTLMDQNVPLITVFLTCLLKEKSALGADLCFWKQNCTRNLKTGPKQSIVFPTQYYFFQKTDFSRKKSWKK